MLRAVVQPIERLSNWVRGCPCHGEERRKFPNRQVRCQLAGCRAPALSGRLDTALTELQDVRDKFWTSPDIAAAVNVVLGNLRLKLAWVWDEPYLVWRADDQSIARQLLDQHDAMIKQGLAPHRVTSYLCGFASGSLRSDMVSHASGGQLSDRLRAEIRAYQLCKVDDTWAEAAHRDVSGCRGRKTGAKVAYVAATQRLGQTLSWLYTVTAAELDTFYTCMRQWKAIGQLAPGRQKCLVPVAQKLSRVLAQVYRYDSAGVRDWGVELDAAIKRLSDRPAARLQIVQRLQVEYLLSSIRNGDTLSIAEAIDATLQEARAIALAELPALFGNQPDEATAF